MAYDTLKAEIRQYIKTNGANEITGQILQNVLLDMVNAYPSLDGYATQLWVQNQRYVTESELSGYATQQWVSQQLGGYLPLTGGNLDGNLSIYDTMNIYSSSIEWNDSGDYCRIAFDDDGITVTAHGTGYVIANEFIRNGGTSSQFLKADGSVDNNTYLSSADLSGYATELWVGNNYLPLTGGNLNGNLSIYGTMNIYSSSIEWNDNGDYCRIAFDDDGITVTAHGTGYVIANEFIRNGGTSTQFLKADGSVDSNTYLTSAAISDMATMTWVGQQGFLTSVPSGYATETWVGNNYLALTGGNLNGNLSIYGTMNIYSSSIEWNDNGDYCRIAFDDDGITVTAHGTGYVIANEFIRNGGTSTQFLKADGSVDSNTYLTSAAISDMATQTWVGQQGFLTSSSLSGYATQQWVGQQGFLTSVPSGYATQTWVGQQGYITSSAISDMATQTWVGQQGFLTSVPSGYATETWVDNNYLPLTGGNLNGNLSIYDTMNIYSSSIEWNDDGDYCRIVFDNDGITVASHGTGYVIANEFIQTSDIRRKNIISDIGMDIGDIAKSPIFRFTMKDDDEGIVRVGTSAQYWQTVIPEVVSEDKHGVLGLQYDVAALAGVITVAKRVVDHEQRIAELEKENALLKAKLNIN